jgi:hypothetical protein
MGPLNWNWVTKVMLQSQIRETLKAAAVPFSEQVAVDGYQADFVFQTPDGQRHIVEAKAWEPSRSDVTRAKKLAANLKTLPVDGSYVVLEKLNAEQPSEGLVSVKGLHDLLQRAVVGQAQSPVKQPASAPAKVRRIVFAAMPFAPKYDDVFFVAIRGAAKLARSAAKRVDQDEYTGDVVERIRQRIAQASAVVVDLSESRPNVLYEMGFAHASGKPVVPICSTPVEEIPFDVRNLSIITYQAGQTSALRPKLSRRLRAVLE